MFEIPKDVIRRARLFKMMQKDDSLSIVSFRSVKIKVQLACMTGRLQMPIGGELFTLSIGVMWAALCLPIGTFRATVLLS